MPANPLSVVIRWLASHLVALSLLGFLGAGLCVTGILDCPWSPPPEASLVSRSPGAAGNVSPPAPVISSQSTTAEKGTAGLPGEAGTGAPPGTPRFIGGTIPLREPQGSPAADGFRPSDRVPPPPLPLGRDEHLQLARQAFWDGDFEAAEAAYVGTIGQFPGDADAFGELANLYLAMGKVRAARDAIYEAGIRLKVAGEQDRLQQVIDYLRKEGDQRAEELVP